MADVSRVGLLSVCARSSRSGETSALISQFVETSPPTCSYPIHQVTDISEDYEPHQRAHEYSDDLKGVGEGIADDIGDSLFHHSVLRQTEICPPPFSVRPLPLLHLSLSLLAHHQIESPDVVVEWGRGCAKQRRLFVGVEEVTSSSRVMRSSAIHLAMRPLHSATSTTRSCSTNRLRWSSRVGSSGNGLPPCCLLPCLRLSRDQNGKMKG